MGAKGSFARVIVATALTVTFLLLSGLAPAWVPTTAGTPVSSAPTPQSHQAVPYRTADLTVPDAQTVNTSYVSAEEPPILPPTTPTIVTLFTGTESAASFGGNFSAPPMPLGGWGMIELNFTTSLTGTVYDVGYFVWLNNVDVLFGTLPEYGQATVLKNITEYESAIQGTVQWDVHHNACLPSCTVTTLSLSFYPAAPGFPAPAAPNEVLPIWNTTLSSSEENNTTVAAVPTDTTRAVLEVYPYGYGVDEFWYMNEPSFRAVNISVDGRNLAYILPFPYINTGGINPYAWRPITGTFTLNDPPDTIDLTPALGAIEGSANWTVSIAPTVTSGSSWQAIADLLVYTTPGVSAAQLTSYSWTNFTVATSATPSCTDFVSPLCYFNQTANASYSYSSTVTGSAGTFETAATSSSFAFVNDQLITPIWQNVTGTETTLTTTTTTVGNLATSDQTTISFPLGLQIGAYFMITGTDSYNCNGSPCPEGNYTDLLNNVYQTYNVTNQVTTTTPNGTLTSLTYVNETTLVPQSSWIGAVEFFSPTSGGIIGLLLNYATTVTVYTQYNAPNDPNMLYTHTIVGSDYITNATVATMGNDVENVYYNAATRAVTSVYVETLLAQLNGQISKLNGQVSQLLTEVSTLEGQLTVAQATITSLKMQLANSTAQLSTVWADYNNSGIENAQLNTTIVQDRQEIGNLTAEVNSLTATVSSTNGYFSPTTLYTWVVVAVVVTAIVVFLVTYLAFRRREPPRATPSQSSTPEQTAETKPGEGT
jgi:hypothetical protein